LSWLDRMRTGTRASFHCIDEGLREVSANWQRVGAGGRVPTLRGGGGRRGTPAAGAVPVSRWRSATRVVL